MALVHTAGHSTRTAEELLGLLGAHRIERLVDVRRFPASRRHPQFSRPALEAALAAAGISYRHEPDLGGRRTPHPSSPHTAWRVAAFRGYADHMETPEFAAALARLIHLAEDAEEARVGGGTGGGTVILCAEAVPWRCHRRLIADALVARGVEVRHILGREEAPRHELDPNARILPGGRLLYDRGGSLPLFERPRP